MNKEKTYPVNFTAKELWEVMALVRNSYLSGHPDNKVADAAMNKLNRAWEKVPPK